MRQERLIQTWRKGLKVGDAIHYKGHDLSVLGFASSLDSNGCEMVEIAWNNKLMSLISGYLAVSRDELEMPGSYVGIDVGLPETKCECGSDAVGSPAHSSWCPAS